MRSCVNSARPVSRFDSSCTRHTLAKVVHGAEVELGIGVTLLDENTELGWTPVVRQPARWAGLTFFLPTCGRFVSVWFLSEEHGRISHAASTRWLGSDR